MGTVRLLAEALTHGGKVLWDSPERPKLILPKGVRERLEPDREAIREVLRRAALFREQVGRPGPWPILALPGREEGDGCLSCGAKIDRDRFRCELCALAVRLALEERP